VYRHGVGLGEDEGGGEPQQGARRGHLHHGMCYVCLLRSCLFDVALRLCRTTCPSRARTLTPDPPASCSTSSTRYVYMHICIYVCAYLALLMNVCVCAGDVVGICAGDVRRVG
jgi:hypothetical protein